MRTPQPSLPMTTVPVNELHVAVLRWILLPVKSDPEVRRIKSVHRRDLFKEPSLFVEQLGEQVVVEKLALIALA